MMSKNKCKVEGCEKASYTVLGLCCAHYQRYQRYGDVDSYYEARISDIDKQERRCQYLARQMLTENDRELFKRGDIYRQNGLDESLDKELYVYDLLRQIEDKGFI